MGFGCVLITKACYGDGRAAFLKILYHQCLILDLVDTICDFNPYKTNFHAFKFSHFQSLYLWKQKTTLPICLYMLEAMQRSQNGQCFQSGWLGRAMVLGSFQCRGVLLLWHMVGQGPAVLAAGAGWLGHVFFFFFKYRLSYLPFLMPHLLGEGWTFCNIVVSAVLTQR